MFFTLVAEFVYSGVGEPYLEEAHGRKGYMVRAGAWTFLSPVHIDRNVVNEDT